ASSGSLRIEERSTSARIGAGSGVACIEERFMDVSKNVVAYASLEATWCNFSQCRDRFRAGCDRIGAARSEDATRRWIDRAWDIPLQQPASTARVRVGARRCFEQRLRVGMLGRHVQLSGWCDFHHLAEVEHH